MNTTQYNFPSREIAQHTNHNHMAIQLLFFSVSSTGKAEHFFLEHYNT